MSDIEKVKACAEAMGYGVTRSESGELCTLGDALACWGSPELDDEHRSFAYNPLHDDAQAMALVKRFHLNIGQTTQGVKVFTTPLKGGFHEADSPDLNRAIVECVSSIPRKAP